MKRSSTLSHASQPCTTLKTYAYDIISNQSTFSNLLEALMGMLLLFLLFVFIAALFLIAGILAWVRARGFARSAVRARGTVTALVYGSSEGQGSYWPRVRFQGADGKDVEFEAAGSGRLRAYEVGQSVDVMYDPQNHGSARIVTSQ